MLMTHGWPGSHHEFWPVIEKLAFPSRFGARPEDAFDLVVPSLPGFGLSSKSEQPIGQRATAAMCNTLMTQVLGYDRYRAQGRLGIGGHLLARRHHADHVQTIHLTRIGLRATGGAPPSTIYAWLKRQHAALSALGAYFRLQTTKPQSLAWLAAGNPVGQAPWIAERFHDWSDLSERSFDEVLLKDQPLTNIMLYVMTGSFVTGA